MDTPERQERVEKARGLIFKKGYSRNSTVFENTLGERSEVPIHIRFTMPHNFEVNSRLTSFQNAFSNHLHRFGFNFYQMFAPDILHEVELGVWKAIFTHLIRILYAADPHGKLVTTLNER